MDITELGGFRVGDYVRVKEHVWAEYRRRHPEHYGRLAVMQLIIALRNDDELPGYAALGFPWCYWKLEELEHVSVDVSPLFRRHVQGAALAIRRQVPGMPEHQVVKLLYDNFQQALGIVTHEPPEVSTPIAEAGTVRNRKTRRKKK